MTDDKQKAAEEYVSIPLKGLDRCAPLDDVVKWGFIAGADWAMEKMSAEINRLTYELDKSRDSHTKKINELEAKCERYEKALRAIGRNAEELNKITNFDTLNAIIDTAKNALTEKWDAEEMMKKVSK